MARAVRVGVIGVGSLGQSHARICAGLPSADLIGVYDVDAERANRVANEHGTRAFTSLDELVREIEAATVVVPTDRHHAVALALLDKGIHLLVEKPIAASTAEAEAMVARAQELGRILQVGHIERFNPVMAYLEGMLTEPQFIEAHRLAPFPPPRPGLLPRGTEVSVVLDLMIHDLEVILHLVGSPVRDFHAVGVPVLSESDDIANVRLQFENGCIANVTASRISAERMRKIRVFQGEVYLSLDYQNQAGELYRRAGGEIRREDVPIEKGDALTAELDSFLQCVERRDQPVVSGEHAAEALRLAAAISQRIRERPS